MLASFNSLSWISFNFLIVITIFKNISLFNVILSSVLSSLTVGGKAIGKKIAIKHANDIIYFVGKIISIFSKKK